MLTDKAKKGDFKPEKGRNFKEKAIMDPAEAKMIKIKSKQREINEVIDRGDSDIQKFYEDTTVFVTGGFGFLGKQLIEKLFRSCEIKKLYLLSRPKKGKSSQERLQIMLKDPVFDSLHEKKPHFVDRIVPIDGDVAEIRLGVIDDDWNKLTKEVNIIFHAAAALRFDTPLREATFTNVRGSRETMQLARECNDFKSFIYVSTASNHMTIQRINCDLFEQFYPCPLPAGVMISLAEELDAKKLEKITANLIKDWPNTYTFTKALAEDLIETTGHNLPICVVRPPLVTPSYLEPAPGWLDSSVAYGPLGIILGIIMGFIHVFQCSEQFKFEFTPVDFVNNALIAAGWDTDQRKKCGDEKIPVYTVANSNCYIGWKAAFTYMNEEGRKFSSPKAVWYCNVYRTENKYIYKLLVWLLHYIPAFIFDTVSEITGRKPFEGKSVLSILKKIDKIISIYSHFFKYKFIFHDDNVRKMMDRMSDADKIMYNCDISTIDVYEYIILIGLGLRKYIIKDGLKGTEDGYKRQKLFRMLNYLFFALYVFVFCCVLFAFFCVVRYVVGI